MARRKTQTTSTTTVPGFVRSFPDTSYWNRKVTNVPIDPNSAAMIAGQARICAPPTLGSPAGAWAMPWSEAKATDPMATIRDAKGNTVKLRVNISIGAMTGDDGAIVWRDFSNGVEVATFETIVPRRADGKVDVSHPITCTGYSIFGTNTEGLARQVGGSQMNTGHRGCPASAMAVHPLEQTGIHRRLKCSLGQPGDSPGPNFPYYGIESPRNGFIPEGAVLWLPDPDPNSPMQMALYEYGVLVGDTAGAGKATIKTVQGGAYSQSFLTSLDALTWDRFEVLELGFRL